MTQDEIIGMAAVAGITFRKMTIDGEGYDYRYVDLNDNIGTDEAGCVERFAALVAAKAAAAEREACAVACEQKSDHKEAANAKKRVDEACAEKDQKRELNAMRHELTVSTFNAGIAACAKAIRARGCNV